VSAPQPPAANRASIYVCAGVPLCRISVSCDAIPKMNSEELTERFANHPPFHQYMRSLPTHERIVVYPVSAHDIDGIKNGVGYVAEISDMGLHSRSALRKVRRFVCATRILSETLGVPFGKPRCLLVNRSNLGVSDNTTSVDRHSGL
jgi:hypothetical protein